MLYFTLTTYWISQNAAHNVRMFESFVGKECYKVLSEPNVQESESCTFKQYRKYLQKLTNEKCVLQSPANVEFESKRCLDGLEKNLKLWWSRQKQNSGEKTADEKSSLEKRQRMGKAASKDFDSFLQMALKSWSQKHTCKWEHAESWGIVFWELGPPDKFQASDGWLGRWKIRFTVSIKTISGTVTK